MDKEIGVDMFSIFLITVNPEQYYGSSYHYVFKNEKNAMKKFDKLVEKHNLCHSGDYRIAQRDSESLHHIDTIELEEIFFTD